MAAETDSALQKEMKRRIVAARQMRTGILYHLNPVSALAVSEAERRAEYEARWAAGGTAFMAAFSDLLTNDSADLKNRLKDLHDEVAVGQSEWAYLAPVLSKARSGDTACGRAARPRGTRSSRCSRRSPARRATETAHASPSRRPTRT